MRLRLIPVSLAAFSTVVSLLAETIVAQQLKTAKVLLYTATAEFRHDSIPTAIEALKNISSSYNVEFDATEDKSVYTEENLAQYDAIMWVSTSGDVLDDDGKAAFRDWLDKGGNFIGVHEAADTLRSDPWYGNELGAYFNCHPEFQNATVDVLDSSHPSTSMLPTKWQVQDEMYNFMSDPRAIGAVVVLSADNLTYTDTCYQDFDQGTPHPTAWYQEHGAGVDSGSTAGRSFYTSLGHSNASWQDALFMQHVMGGVTWALQSDMTKAFNSNGLVGNTQGPSLISGTSSSGSAASSSGPSSSSTSSDRRTRVSSSNVLMALVSLPPLYAIGLVDVLFVH